MKGSKLFFPIQNETGQLHFIECGTGGRIEIVDNSYRVTSAIIGYQTMQGTVVIPTDNILFVYYSPGSVVPESADKQLRKA